MNHSRMAFLICLYGLFDPERRTAIEMAGYRSYLQTCAGYIRRHAGKGAIIVLAGGFTTELDISEAASVERYLVEWLSYGPCTFTILKEERSKDTWENLRFGWGKIKTLGPEITSLTIFCDRYRRFKVWALAWHLLKEENIPWWVKSFPRKDIHPNSSWRHQIPDAIKAFLFGGRRLND